jgi:hypothetical protein
MMLLLLMLLLPMPVPMLVLGLLGLLLGLLALLMLVLVLVLVLVLPLEDKMTERTLAADTKRVARGDVDAHCPLVPLSSLILDESGRCFSPHWRKVLGSW